MARASVSLGRGNPREPVYIVVMLFGDSDGARVSRSSWMLDVTMRGARVRTTLVVPPGRNVEVCPFLKPILTVPARVVWTRKQAAEEDFEMGLEFQRPVPTDFWTGPGLKVA